MERLLWEVQTLAANLPDGELQEVRDDLERRLGETFTNSIIVEWEHELEDNDD